MKSEILPRCLPLAQSDKPGPPVPPGIRKRVLTLQAQAPYRSTIAAPLDCGCHLGIFVAGLWIKNPRESPQSWGRHVPANRVPRTEYLPRDPRTMDVTRQGAKRQSPREGNGITHGLGGVPGPIVRARPTDYGGNSLTILYPIL